MGTEEVREEFEVGESLELIIGLELGSNELGDVLDDAGVFEFALLQDGKDLT